jgi:hypothetical protein
MTQRFSARGAALAGLGMLAVSACESADKPVPAAPVATAPGYAFQAGAVNLNGHAVTTRSANNGTLQCGATADRITVVENKDGTSKLAIFFHDKERQIVEDHSQTERNQSGVSINVAISQAWSLVTGQLVAREVKINGVVQSPAAGEQHHMPDRVIAHNIAFVGTMCRGERLLVPADKQKPSVTPIPRRGRVYEAVVREGGFVELRL